MPRCDAGDMRAERKFSCARHGVVEPVSDDRGLPVCPSTVVAGRAGSPPRPPRARADEPDYFVFRGGTSSDGVWVDRRNLGDLELGAATDAHGRVIPMRATGEFETGNAGAVTGVWRPLSREA